MDTTTTAFDTEALRRGIEERDAGTLRGLYAPDAEMTVVDKNATPSRPQVLRGRTAIGDYLDETCGRDMTHRLERVVVSGDTAAFTQACAYPDGPGCCAWPCSTCGTGSSSGRPPSRRGTSEERGHDAGDTRHPAAHRTP